MCVKYCAIRFLVDELALSGYLVCFRLWELHEAIDAEMGTSLTATTLPVCVGDYVIAKFPVDKR